MCGICGKLNLSPEAAPVGRELISRMMQTIRHRGPDDNGIYLSGEVGLGHLRLKIIDLKTGKQPLSNEDGTVWVIYNGEIYNYPELTAFLVGKGHQFRTATDTEVIVHLYEELGEASIARLRGMFSFALWDNKKKLLLLARDRVGIKPLYYRLTDRSLIFSSEVKAILADPDVTAEVETTLLERFLKFDYMPGEQTLFKGISKLSPGHYLVASGGKVKISRYWDLSFSKSRATLGLNACQEELSGLLKETVSDHMISDVPVGVLLSGGVDSTAVLGFATEAAGRPVSSFTIGFDGTECIDERPYAAIAARKFGSQHYDMTIGPDDFLSCLPKYVWHMEEPVCEPPAIALYYVSKMAKEHVTVLLSGEGADEAFAGYQDYRNYAWLEAIKRVLGPATTAASRLLAGLGSFDPSHRLSRYVSLMNLPLESYYYSRSSDPSRYFNRNRANLVTESFRQELNPNGHSHALNDYFRIVAGLSKLDQMLYIDIKTWLPDDLLIKADKMTMANSLELRVPFLDHRVLEFAASLPARYKLRGLTTKYILKKALSKVVPQELLNRKKVGFPIPYEKWIRVDFASDVQGILTDRKTIQRGYFKRAAVESLLEENSRTGKFSAEIFSLMTLELWHRTFIDGDVAHLS